MVNIITSCRILCSIALLFFYAFSPMFYVLYLLAGFTDIIDGMLARKTNTVSEFGSKLDTVADFIFVVACFVKMLPMLYISKWFLIWIVVIAIIKIINVMHGFIVYKKLVAEHTIMNKVTGLMIFVVPLTLNIVDLNYSTFVVCCVATFAAIQEGYYIRVNGDGLK